MEEDAFLGDHVNGNRMRESFLVKMKKKTETARERAQEPFKKTARGRTQEPVREDDIRRKGGEFRITKNGRWKKRRRKKKREV